MLTNRSARRAATTLALFGIVGGLLYLVDMVLPREAHAQVNRCGQGMSCTVAKLTTTAASETPAIVMADGSKLCLNGSDCTLAIKRQAGWSRMRLDMPTTGWNLFINGGIEVAGGTNILLGGTYGWTVSGTTIYTVGGGLGKAPVQGGRFESTAASGANGFSLLTDGARLDLGSAATDYFYADGTGWMYAAGSFAVSGNASLNYNGGTTSVRVLNVSSIGLATCSSGIEGDVQRDGAAGGTKGARTRVCMCTSDGAATPAYAWQNIVTGTIGTATTCAN